MATLQQLEQALRAADAAGNAEDAQRLAQAYAAARGAQDAPQRSMEERYAAAGIDPAAPDPTEGMGFGEKLAAGFGKAFVDTGRGVRQLYAQAADAIDPREQSLSGLITGEDSSRAGEMQREIDQSRQADAPLMDTGAGLTGNVLGYGAQILGPGALARGTMLAKAALPTTLAGNAAQGAVLAGTQPVATGETRIGNAATGAGFGAGGALLAKGVGVAAPKVLQATRNMLSRPTASGAERQAGAMIAGEAGNINSLLQPQPSRIPGVQRTLAEESMNPGVARLERQMRGQSNNFQPIDAANNAARVNALESFAGDRAKIAEAVTARATAANPLRREALKIDGVDTNRLLSQIKRLENAQEGRPAVQAGLQQIRSLLTRQIPDAERTKAAVSSLQDFIASDRTSATNREAAKQAISQIRAGEWPTVSFITGDSGTAGVGASYDAAKAALADARKALGKETTGQDKVAIIDNVRKTIGDMLSGKYGGDSAQALAGSRELMAIKNQLDRVLEKQAPAYGQYLDAFRQGSRPINRMETGQELLAKGSGSVADPTTGLRPLLPASFSKAARDLDATAASATGFRKAKAADILAPEDMAVIRAVQDDLERQAFRSTAGSGGNSMTDERRRLGEKMGTRLAGKIPFIGGFAEALNTLANQRVNERLAYLLANPAEARRVLETLGKKDRSVLTNALIATASGIRRTATPVGESAINQRPLEIDVRGGTPIPVEQARLEYGGG